MKSYLTVNHIMAHKVMQGFFKTKLKSDVNIGLQASLSRTTNKTTTSHFVGYLDAIIDQEIPTMYLQHKRQVDQGQEPTIGKNCRLCRTNIEDVVYVCVNICETFLKF